MPSVVPVDSAIAMRRPSRTGRQNPRPNPGRRQPNYPDPSIGIAPIDENRLHPLGLPGINLLEPNFQLVDPWQWFTSPIHGNYKSVTSVDVSVSPDGCIVCISVRGTLGWLEAANLGDGFGFCWIRPECRRPPQEPLTPDELLPGDLSPVPIPPIDIPLEPGDEVSIEYTFKSGKHEITNVCNGQKIIRPLFTPPPGEISYFVSEYTNLVIHAPPAYISPTKNRYYCPGDPAAKTGIPLTSWGYFLKIGQNILQPGFIGFNTSLGANLDPGLYLNWWIWDYRIKVNGQDVTNPPGKEPPPPPLPEDDEMSCCANQRDNTELLRKIYQKVGGFQMPVSLPESFNRSNSNTVFVDSVPEMIRWAALAIADLIGEFPKKIRIDDSDLTEPGNQPIEIELPNLAEAIADMYGADIKSLANSEVVIRSLMRIATEVCASKVAALQSQAYARANAEALGYRFQVKETPVDFAIDIDNEVDTIDELLRNSTKAIQIYTQDEDNSLWEYLQKMMYLLLLQREKSAYRGTTEILDETDCNPQEGREVVDILDSLIEKINQDGFYNINPSVRRPFVEKIDE